MWDLNEKTGHLLLLWVLSFEVSQWTDVVHIRLKEGTEQLQKKKRRY
jgi:hypothetical protein